MKFLQIYESDKDRYKISKALKEVRENTGLTQEYVAKFMGVSVSKVQDLESLQDSSLDDSDIDRYLLVFGIQIEYISKLIFDIICSNHYATTGKPIDFEALRGSMLRSDS